MTFDTCRFIFIAGGIAAGVMLAVTVLLFFLLRIPWVIGDLTGANARRGIEDIERRRTGAGGGLSLSERLPQKSRGRNTSGTARPGRMKARATDRFFQNKRPTSKLTDDDTVPLNAASGATETTMLDVTQGDSAETVLLNGNDSPPYETTLYRAASGNEAETVLLSEQQAAQLYQTTYVRESTNRTAPLESDIIQGVGDFEVVEDITYIHTDEVI